MTWSREIIVADDLDITWLSHKLLGEKYVKAAVFELLNHDPDSSALTTFTTPQLVFFFLLHSGLLAIGLVLNFKSVSIIINVIMSLFFLVAIFLSCSCRWWVRGLNCTRQ